MTQPNFVTFDTKEREAFLSQFGNFSPNEREIFHRLVKMWSPAIPFKSIFSIMSAESVSAKNDIESLVKKLKNGKIAVLTTAIIEGVRSPQFIVLCNPEDFSFYQKIVEEELMDVIADLLQPLPSVKSLMSKNFGIPESCISKADFKTIAQLHAKKEVPEQKILVIEARGTQFLISSQNIKRFITVALAKLQIAFQNTNLLSLMSQLRNIGLMELKKQIENRDPEFWIQFSKEILENYETLKQNRKLNLEDQFWSICHLMQEFLTHQKEEFLRKKQAEEDKLLDMRAIMEEVKKTPNLILKEEEFAEILLSYKNKHENEFQEFKNEFEEKFLTPPDKKSLAPLVHLNRFYIHQENVHPYFLMNLERMGKNLYAIYVRFMEHYLKHSKNEYASIFYSKENFENDIAEQTKRLDPIFYDMLQRPNLIAEAIILSVRKHKDLKAPEDLRSSLSPFFYSDKIKFLELSQLFGLNTLELYRFAFLRFSILRQIIFKLTGKYESMQKKFSDFAKGETSASQSSSKIRSDEGSLAKELEQEDTAASRRERQSLKGRNALGYPPSSSLKGKVVKQQATPIKDKNYSSHEKDQAWKQFSKTIKKD